MARPIKRRRICGLPHIQSFRPCAGQNSETAKIPPPVSGETASVEIIEITVDEYEAIRLIDYLNLSQEDCAAQMNVARTTVQAIYDSARKKLADMLVNGRQLNISGGSYDLCPFGETCCGKNCGHRRCREQLCEKEQEQQLYCHACKRHET